MDFIWVLREYEGQCTRMINEKLKEKKNYLREDALNRDLNDFAIPIMLELKKAKDEERGNG